MEYNSTCFGQFLCPSSGVFHCTHSNGICHTGSGWNWVPIWTYSQAVGKRVPSWSCSQAVSKPVWHTPWLCVQWKTPDDGQRNCPKRVEFYSTNKFEKLVHLVSFLIRKPNKVVHLLYLYRPSIMSCVVRYVHHSHNYLSHFLPWIKKGHTSFRVLQTYFEFTGGPILTSTSIMLRSVV